MYQIKGKIDSTNAAEFEKEIMAAQPKEIDASQLKYISSAGLRVLLKLAKTVGDVTVNNVSSEVYEIFDVTGFTEILNVRKAFREIDINGKEKIGQGGNGTVYRLDDERIVKVYRKEHNLEFIEREQQYAKSAFVSGIPSVITFDIVKVGECYGVVFEAMNSDTLSHAIVTEPEKKDEYIMKYVQLAKTLHTTEIKGDTIITLKELLYSRLDDEFMKEALSAEEIAVLHSIVDAMKDTNTLVHGDFHPGNIMLQNGELMLIDMGEVTRGVPIYDVASVFRDLISAPKNNPDIIRMSMGLEPELAMEIGTKFIAMYTGITDPQALEGYMKQLGLVYAFNVVMLLTEMPLREMRAPLVVENLLRPVVIPNAAALKHILSK